MRVQKSGLLVFESRLSCHGTILWIYCWNIQLIADVDVVVDAAAVVDYLLDGYTLTAIQRDHSLENAVVSLSHRDFLQEEQEHEKQTRMENCSSTLYVFLLMIHPHLMLLQLHLVPPVQVSWDMNLMKLKLRKEMKVDDMMLLGGTKRISHHIVVEVGYK